MKARVRVVIVGGGTAGISVAARLARTSEPLEILLIEPSERHFYQPLWTLVGAGIFNKEKSCRAQAGLIPKGVEWIRDAAAGFAPENNVVELRSGRKVSYDYLVVAPGLQIDWSRIEGLDGHVGRNGICSNYSYETVASTWQMLQAFQGGTAIFTQPSSPIKCGGAPQKICYLAEEYFRRSGVRERTAIRFLSGTPSLFPVRKYAEVLEKIAARKKIETEFSQDLVAVDTEKREAIFRKVETGERVSIRYDFLHVTPPMSAPAFLKLSPLADAAGWVDVDAGTLAHRTFPNVFGIGDAASLPTSKTGAAIRKQAPVLVANLLARMAQRPLGAVYDGYTSCPLVTGYNRLVLAEFDYAKQPRETFPFNQAKERYSMYLLKAYGLPAMYWHGMLRGRL